MFRKFKNGKTVLKNGFTVFLYTVCFVGGVYAWPRLGNGAHIQHRNTGDGTQTFTVRVTSGTPKLVYSAYDEDRELFLQNTSTYTVCCGTGSYVRNQTGIPRFNISVSSYIFMTNANYDIWCIAQNELGNRTVEILGMVRYDKKDN